MDTIDTIRFAKSNIVGSAFKVCMVELLQGRPIPKTHRGHLCGSPQFYRRNADAIEAMMPSLRPSVIALLVEAGELDENGYPAARPRADRVEDAA